MWSIYTNLNYLSQVLIFSTHVDVIIMATAFCPAHITGFFKAELDKEDTKQLGSLGAGFSIQKGVKTTVSVREKTKHDISNFSIKVNGFESGDMRVSELVLSKFPIDKKFIDVTHEIDVPVGYGFGCSAAVALSLSIALNNALGCKPVSYTHLTLPTIYSV